MVIPSEGPHCGKEPYLGINPQAGVAAALSQAFSAAVS